MRRRLLLLTSLASTALLLPAPAAVAAGPTLSGTVTVAGEARAGTPVAWFEPGSKAVSATRTDGRGRFTMPAPAAGTRYLIAVNVAKPLSAPRAALDAYLPGYVGTAPDDVPAAPLAQPAVADGASRTVTVDVGRATLLRGRTAAFAGRIVELQTTAGETTATTAATSNGTWSFRVAPGAYRLLVRIGEEWMPYRSRVVRVGSAEVVKIAKPVRTATLQGTVRSSGGRALAGAYVSFDGPDTSERSVGEGVRADRNGHWVRTGLAPGRYRVTAASGSAGSWVPTTAARVLRAGSRSTLDAVLRPGGVLSASVDTGSRTKRWTALLEDRHGAIVATGASPFRTKKTVNPLTVPSLKDGLYRLRVLNGDRMLQAPVRITRHATVRLGVLKPATPALEMTGTAPAGAFVYVTRGQVSGSATAGADGAFRIGGLLPGAYEVRAGTAGRAVDTTVVLPAEAPIVIGDGTPVDTDYRRIRGRVLAGAVPVPLGVVELTDGYRFRIEDGRIEGAVLVAGTYDVRSVLVASSLFPSATPYSVRWTAPRIVVRPGQDTDLGTVSLEVRGGP